ncbi:MAG: hypothetical protein FD143_2149 [Ignavibacteria bacterium]|nr:MAG: hypothetical protein FD143_2149 [Ignavibacteria bacterium]
MTIFRDAFSKNLFEKVITIIGVECMVKLLLEQIYIYSSCQSNNWLLKTVETVI